jgi:hypothetical protein
MHSEQPANLTPLPLLIPPWTGVHLVSPKPCIRHTSSYPKPAAPSDCVICTSAPSSSSSKTFTNPRCLHQLASGAGTLSNLHQSRAMRKLKAADKQVEGNSNSKNWMARSMWCVHVSTECMLHFAPGCVCEKRKGARVGQADWGWLWVGCCGDGCGLDDSHFP